MSLEAKIFKGVSWMAFFNLFTQGFSWIITIVIARLLVPGDYGLMAMSTIITGYALNLSELGLGNAIIQRFEITQKEISSVFWFLMGMTTLLALSCFPLAYLTAYIMHEPRVIPITQTVSLVFLLNGLQIVPSSLLRKEINFKAIGFIEMIATITSCIFMLLIAKSGGGVWTLIFGFIIRSFVRTLLLFNATKWRPLFHFNFKESKQYLSFGIIQAIGSSLFYIQQSSDKFFAGRAWKPELLGYYSFAQTLANIPTDKIVSLINNVSFPALAKVQNDQAALNSMYLNISKVTSMIVIPLFIGGYLLGEDIIRIMLNPKWFPMITLFKLLCLAQIVTGLNAINNFVHAARGKPKMAMYYNIACAIAMPISFYFAVQKGLNAIAIPWLSTYLVLAIGWIIITLRHLSIPLTRYIANLWPALSGTAVMALCVVLVHTPMVHNRIHGNIQEIVYFIACTLVGLISYCLYMWFTEKRFLTNLRNLLKK